MEHVDALLSWLESYRPAELFDETGKLVPEIAEIAPKGDRRMAMNPITNAGAVSYTHLSQTIFVREIPFAADRAAAEPPPGAGASEPRTLANSVILKSTSFIDPLSNPTSDFPRLVCCSQSLLIASSIQPVSYTHLSNECFYAFFVTRNALSSVFVAPIFGLSKR